MSKLLRDWWVALALALMLGWLALLRPEFFATANLLQMGTALAPVLLVACGVSLVILTRQIDVSVGTQLSWCSVLFALAAAQGWPMPAAAAGAIAAGLALGAINGALIAGLRLPSIVVTLAMMLILRNALAWWRQGEEVSGLPANFQWLGQTQLAGQYTILLAAAVVFLLLVFALRFLSAGRFFYATGSDEDAARLAGLRPGAVTFAGFVLCGGLSGLAAVLGAIRFTKMTTNEGQGLEMRAIAAAVVGGIAIAGGRGSLWGVLAGVLLLATIAPAMVFFGIPAPWERVIQGAIILLAVAASVPAKKP